MQILLGGGNTLKKMNIAMNNLVKNMQLTCNSETRTFKGSKKE